GSVILFNNFQVTMRAQTYLHPTVIRPQSYNSINYNKRTKGGFSLKILKWTIFIVLAIIILLVISAYMLFKSNPNYVLKHLEKNPENSALYVSVDNNEKIAYKADTPRPLASVAKI